MICMENTYTIHKLWKELCIMYRTLRFIPFLLVLLLAVSWMPSTASAYSYGNPNEEAVAQNYKQVVEKLNLNPPDYAAALQTFQPIKDELDMHMGKEPAAAIEKALQGKDKATAIDAFQRTLVLNIARRMESIDKDFANYEQNKLLLAKALATYEVLSPIVKAKDAATNDKIRKDFDTALESLGNPGLFGVGVKPADQSKFKITKDDILKTLQSEFKMASLEVGHFAAGSGPEGGNAGHQQDEAAAGNTQWKNWLPIVLIVLVLGLIAFRTLRKRRDS